MEQSLEGPICPAWQQYRHVGIRMLISLGDNQLLCGPGQMAVRAIDHSKWRIEIETVPKLLQALSLLLVDLEMHCGQLVSRRLFP